MSRPYLENNSWICDDSCYHEIQESRCDCKCHKGWRLQLKNTLEDLGDSK